MEYTVITSDSVEFKLPSEVVMQSGFMKNMVELIPGTDEPLVLPTVDANDFVIVLEFMRQNAVEPVTRLRRPLPLPDVASSEAPAWAVAYVKSLPFGTKTVDLLDVVSSLQIPMLEQLICARIAAEVLKVPQDQLPLLRNEPEKRLSFAEEKELKMQNRWAWEEPVSDVLASDFV